MVSVGALCLNFGGGQVSHKGPFQQPENFVTPSQLKKEVIPHHPHIPALTYLSTHLPSSSSLGQKPLPQHQGSWDIETRPPLSDYPPKSCLLFRPRSPNLLSGGWHYFAKGKGLS